MTYNTDDLEDELEFEPSEQDARNEIIHRARTVGAHISFEAALAIAGSEKAPPQARMAAVRTILEVGGLLHYRDRAANDETKDISELNGIELNQRIAHIQAKIAARAEPVREPTKDVSQLTGDELAQRIAKLQAEIAARANMEREPDAETAEGEDDTPDKTSAFD